jgi:hypothetical protein
MEELYNVTIWNYEGDVVKAYWSVTADEVDDIQEEYADDPMHSVVVEVR